MVRVYFGTWTVVNGQHVKHFGFELALKHFQKWLDFQGIKEYSWWIEDGAVLKALRSAEFIKLGTDFRNHKRCWPDTICFNNPEDASAFIIRWKS